MSVVRTSYVKNHNQQQASVLHKNANFLEPTNEHPLFGLHFDNINKALGL